MGRAAAPRPATYFFFAAAAAAFLRFR